MRLLLVGILFFNFLIIHAQEAETDTSKKAGPVQIDFMIGYYEQDGNHSAVTGGIGTEELDDIATQIEVYVPLNKKQAISTSIHFNHYTSASTDKIDGIVSSASFMDNRAQVSVGYHEFRPKIAYSLIAGGSIESDYMSTWLGASFVKGYKNDQTIMTGGFTAFFDQWLMIFPTELRSVAQYDLGNRLRRTMVAKFGIDQTLHPKWRAGINLEAVYQWGLLSTPFHRVYFSDTSGVAVERLPRHRFKVPIAAWVNWAAANKLMLHFNQRVYGDQWGIFASTTEFSLTYEPVFGLRFHPHARFHIQSGANYFYDFEEASFFDQYYTSDWDLSALNTWEVGLGVKYAPLYGRSKEKPGRAAFRYIHTDFSYFSRSDGLWSYLLTFGLGFQL